MKKIICKTCNGKKVQTIVNTLTSEGWHEDDPVEIDCISCNGKGYMNKKELNFYNHYNNIWCKCENSSGSKYYDDNEHEEVSKHHYRCYDCGKVTQIG